LPLQSWPDFRKWDQRNEFKLDEAAALWFNAEPRFPMWWRARWKLHQLHALIAARADVAPQPAPAEPGRQRASAEVPSVADRDTLKTLAEREGRHPLFLYPEFRFRSRDRDNGTEKARIATIHECVLSAISSAESELDGLRRRLEYARQAAAAFLANTNGQNDEDHPERTDQTSVEVRLLAPERRMEELRSHVAALRRIESAVNKELNA
jgi:endonuclease YncB( thermonuclease family)